MRVLIVGIIVLALAVAGVSTYLIKTFSGEEKVAELKKEAQKPKVRVLIAAKEIRPGEILAANAVAWQAWVEDALNPQFISITKDEDQAKKVADLAGSIVRRPIQTGEPILASKLFKRDKAGLLSGVLESGMQVYWWNPMFDDPDAPDSITAELQAMNRFPCVNAGGNVGSAAWMMAGEVLGKPKVALTGVDFSYYDETPHRNTQYYKEAVALVGEDNLDQVFIRLFNPHVNAWFYTDPAYMWYRESFLEMARDAEYQTFNCTGGGILFGDAIAVCPLSEFLDKHA